MTAQENSKKKKSLFPISRLKKIMQTNDDVGKISASVPVVASKAIELFLKEFVGQCLEETKKKEGNRITMTQLTQVVNSNPKFEFLKKMESFKN